MSKSRPGRRAPADGSASKLYEAQRHKLPLPPARLLEQPMVYWPDTDRLIAPWPRGALTWDQERVLLAVLARVAALHVDTPCWVWPDRDPEPLKTEGDVVQWLARWGESRASYMTRKAA